MEDKYPGIMERIKAMMIDGILLTICLILFSYLYSFFDNVPDTVRMVVFIFLFLLYDPLLTSMRGGTIGHMIMGIRVKKESDETKNILFPFALIRYIVKIFLGWISLLSVLQNEKKRALHDYLVGSVVINVE